MKKKQIIILLVVILAASLVGWGFLRFKNVNQPLVYENNLEREVEAVKEELVNPIDSQEKEDFSKLEIEEESARIEPKAQEEKEIEPEMVKKKDEEESADSIKIKNRLVSWGFSNSSKRTIDTIILHSSYNILGGDEYDLDKIIQEYKDYGVAPHYVIDRDGNIFRLVKDNNVAYHAGESKVPDGRIGVNDFSIGIELVNSEKDKFTSDQYAAANDLIEYLKDKYKIKYILGHDEIAPGRKTDPWNINWDKINR